MTVLELLSAASCADRVHHVPDVVNLAIGINLLFPVASSFLKCFLDGLDIDPKKIAEKYLDNLPVSSGDLEEIAVAACAIDAERSRCSPLAWGWWLADFAAAGVGIVILLAGWDRVGLGCLLLFVPVCCAVSCSVRRYVKLKNNFLGAIEKVKSQAAVRKKCDSAFVKDYVRKCSGALGASGAKKKSS